jgi:hypothetical protein
MAVPFSLLTREPAWGVKADGHILKELYLIGGDANFASSGAGQGLNWRDGPAAQVNHAALIASCGCQFGSVLHRAS